MPTGSFSVGEQLKFGSLSTVEDDIPHDHVLAMRVLLVGSLYSLSLSSLCYEKPASGPPLRDSTWVKISLRSGWICSVPQGFTNTPARGIDSAPGILESKKDSIYLDYDSGGDSGLQDPNLCTLTHSTERALKDIQSDFYRTYYKVPSTHTAQIDTINNEVAILVKPIQSGKGRVHLNISSCTTGRWLSITGEQLTPRQEKVVLEIFQTMKLDQ